MADRKERSERLRRREATLAKRRGAFRDTVVSGLIGLGAREIKQVSARSPSQWSLKSRFGPVRIAIRDTSVLCWFVRAGEAAKHLNISPASGTWDHLFVEFSSIDTARKGGRYVVNRIRDIL